MPNITYIYLVAKFTIFAIDLYLDPRKSTLVNYSWEGRTNRFFIALFLRSQSSITIHNHIVSKQMMFNHSTEDY